MSLQAHPFPTPSVDERNVYPTCFEEGTWFTQKLTDEDSPRKIPRAPWAYPDHHDRYVGHNDPDVWTDFDTASEWASKLPGFGLANRVPDVEHDEPRPVFFDFDDVRDPETDEIHPEAWQFIQTHDLPAWLSSSGGGLHAFALVDELPEGRKEQVVISLSDVDGWEYDEGAEPELEVYARRHFCALTGEHVEGTPIDSPDLTEIVGRMFRERAEKKRESRSAFDPDADPEKTREELADVETTSEIEDVFDAIRHTRPFDVRLRSSVTEERADGSKSLDPSWEQSKSGTRLAQVDDGWVYRKGDVGLDALQVVALEERIISSVNDYPSGEDFWRAVDALRSRGAHIPEYESPVDGGDPVVAIPFERLAGLNDQDARAILEEQGVEWPDTTEARERLRNRLFQAFRAGETVAIDAPTSLGKSHTVAAEPWLYRTDITGDAPVIHLSPTKAARDENAEKSREAGVSHAVLKGRKDRCPVARGDHDPNPDPDRQDPDVVLTINGQPVSEWIDQQCEEKGNPFQLAHAYASEYNDQGAELPCCEGDVECPAMTQWEGVPRDDQGDPAVDVVHATHPFAYVPSLRAHTNLVVDEAPGAFTVELTQDRIRRAINAFLDAVNAPVKTYEGFVALATSDGYGGDSGVERDALEGVLEKKPGREWYVEHPDAHALAPDLTRAIYRALRWEDPDANGRRSTRVVHEPPRFDDDNAGGFGGNFLTVVVDRHNEIQTIRHTPDFSTARSVVGLDAHPCEPIWELTVGPRVSVDRVLTTDERRLWRRFERGLTVVQVGEATRPLSGSSAPEWFENDWKLDVLLRTLRDRYGDEFRTAITAAAVEPAMQRRMEEAGVPDPETMHYGEETSRNDFEGETVGLVNGCVDPGDDYVLNLLAELGLEATPERVDPTELEEPTDAHCPSCAGDGCSECDDTGLRRAAGRGFTGPDADTAAALLGGVRENHALQATGRYARNADDPTDRATVYVRTDAVPDGFADVQVNGVEWVASDLQREIIHGLADRNEGASAKGLADDADCGRSHVRKTLKRLEEQGVVDRAPGAGPNPDLWYASMTTLAGAEHVELLEDRDREGKETEQIESTADPPDSTTILSDGGIPGKARTGAYKDLVCGSPSFSAENSGLSDPGPLALGEAEIVADVLGGEPLPPPG